MFWAVFLCKEQLNPPFKVVQMQENINLRDAKSEEHEERAPAIFPPAVLIFGLPRQENMLKKY